MAGIADAVPAGHPHSDAAGVIDAVGEGVDPSRVGQPAWCYGAQSYRAFGTAAQYVVVPDPLAVALPTNTDEVTLEQAACLGIAGITGYRAIFADGSVNGLNVLVYGAARGVGNIAAQMALRDGGRVLAIVRDEAQRRDVERIGVHGVFLADDRDLAAQIRTVAREGVHRIAEVDLGGHIELNAQIVAVGATISSYYSADPQPRIPYWVLGFADTTLRLLGSDDFTPDVKVDAAQALSDALVEGALHVLVSHRVALRDIAHAHELVEQGTAPGRVVVTID